METEKDLGALLLFVEIVDAGNLSEAARRLRMSRANVSYRLTQFERRLGHALLRRTNRLVEPTEIGRRLYAHGCIVRDELHAARESITSSDTGPKGRVRLSLPSGYGFLVMKKWLFAFNHLYPGIALEVTFDNRVENLLRDEVDVAMRIMPDPPQNLIARHMGEIRYIACASAAWAREHAMPTHLEDLQRVPVLTSSAYGRKLLLTGFRDEAPHQILLEPTLISENFLFLRDAVLAGLGVGILPDYLMEDAIGARTVMTCLPQWRLSAFGNHMYMLYMPGRLRAKAMTTFIEFILERAGACPILHGSPPPP